MSSSDPYTYDDLNVATHKIKAMAAALTLSAGSPQGEGADACTIISWMDPGDFELVRRAHRALQTYLRNDLDGCGILETQEAVDLYNDLTEYCYRFSPWFYQDGAWRRWHDDKALDEEELVTVRPDLRILGFQASDGRTNKPKATKKGAAA